MAGAEVCLEAVNSPWPMLWGERSLVVSRERDQVEKGRKEGARGRRGPDTGGS